MIERREFVSESTSPPQDICTRFWGKDHQPPTHSLTHSFIHSSRWFSVTLLAALMIMMVVFIISRNDLLTGKGAISGPPLALLCMNTQTQKRPSGESGLNVLTTLKSCRNKNEISRGSVIHPSTHPHHGHRHFMPANWGNHYVVVRIYLHRGFGRLPLTSSSSSVAAGWLGMGDKLWVL